MVPFYYLAAGLMADALSRKITKRFGLPVVTGYIIVGIALGIFFLHILNSEIISHFNVVIEKDSEIYRSESHTAGWSRCGS